MSYRTSLTLSALAAFLVVVALVPTAHAADTETVQHDMEIEASQDLQLEMVTGSGDPNQGDTVNDEVGTAADTLVLQYGNSGVPDINLVDYSDASADSTSEGHACVYAAISGFDNQVESGRCPRTSFADTTATASDGFDTAYEVQVRATTDWQVAIHTSGDNYFRNRTIGADTGIPYSDLWTRVNLVGSSAGAGLPSTSDDWFRFYSSSTDNKVIYKGDLGSYTDKANYIGVEHRIESNINNDDPDIPSGFAVSSNPADPGGRYTEETRWVVTDPTP